MARNKYPEQTVEKILTVSKKLFNERGYEHTTIADIVAGTGMSKGAFYHHFKSKEEVYDRITDQYYDRMDWMDDVSSVPGRTGLEKIKYLLSFLLSDPDKLALDQMSVSLQLNPRMLLLALESTIRDAAPVVTELIKMGNADGSTHVAQPQETGEAFMILMNLWVGAFVGTKDSFLQKLTFLKTMTDALGFPLIDDALMGVADHYYDSVMHSYAKEKL